MVRDGRLFVLKGVVCEPYVTNGFSNLYTEELARAFALSYSTGARERPASDEQYWNENRDYQLDEACSGPQFACRIGAQVVVAAFPAAVARDGDKVKMVVSQVGENILFAHALMQSSSGEIWLPDCVRTGRIPAAIDNAKTLVYICAWSFIGTTGIGAMLMPIGQAAAIGALFAAFVTVFPAYAWTHDYLTGAGLDYNERIFAVLGFPRPRRVDLSRFFLKAAPRSRTGYDQNEPSVLSYDLWAALRAYGAL